MSFERRWKENALVQATVPFDGRINSKYGAATSLRPARLEGSARTQSPLPGAAQGTSTHGGKMVGEAQHRGADHQTSDQDPDRSENVTVQEGLEATGTYPEYTKRRQRHFLSEPTLRTRGR